MLFNLIFIVFVYWMNNPKIYVSLFWFFYISIKRNETLMFIQTFNLKGLKTLLLFSKRKSFTTIVLWTTLARLFRQPKWVLKVQWLNLFWFKNLFRRLLSFLKRTSDLELNLEDSRYIRFIAITLYETNLPSHSLSDFSDRM